MRVVRGKVAGNTGVVEGEPLPEGIEVTVWPNEPEGFELYRESLDEVAVADLACSRGEGLTVGQLIERLRRVRAVNHSRAGTEEVE